jgi:hypothetical protein
MTEVDLLNFDDNKDDKPKNSKDVIEANNRIKREKKTEANQESLYENAKLDPEKHNIAIKGNGRGPKGDRAPIKYGAPGENRGRKKGDKDKMPTRKVKVGKAKLGPDGKIMRDAQGKIIYEETPK